MRINEQTMNKTKSKEFNNELINLYKANKIEELIKIRDDRNESDEKRVTAYLILQTSNNINRY